MNFKSQWQYYKAAKAQIVLTNAVTGLCQSIHCITWRLVPPVRCKIPIQSTNMESPGLELQRICLHGLRFLQLLLKARNEDNKKDFFPSIYLNSHLSWPTSQSLIGLLLVQGAALSFFWVVFCYQRNFMQCDWIGPNKNSPPFGFTKGIGFQPLRRRYSVLVQGSVGLHPWGRQPWPHYLFSGRTASRHLKHSEEIQGQSQEMILPGLGGGICQSGKTILWIVKKMLDWYPWN